MFNENSVGQRVISKSGDLGIISGWDSKDDLYPLRITFNEFPDEWEWYTKEGYCYLEGNEPHKDIILYPIKQGSPDARRIVAMLASEYRRLSYKMNNYRGQDSTSLHAMESQSAKLYLKAKQLLTSENNNERI